ncbi:MAG: chromate resistance protein [Thermoproteales archaeon]|nr:chromate resistance protein [Thermoproteales archaeon]
MKWVTRKFPHVDHTASAWLIKRFIDPKAEFLFIDWPNKKKFPKALFLLILKE